ncbi:hypothetical protein [Rhodococcus marinonascens]|uniref:hypothetical protein n=1 Tax=Rhodococcus marinonascens TaxID=38311 RepID=UPI000934C0C1|nr:hypothetical protein [Rhodococcus marinonascens]
MSIDHHTPLFNELAAEFGDISYTEFDRAADEAVALTQPATRSWSTVQAYAWTFAPGATLGGIGWIALVTS